MRKQIIALLLIASAGTTSAPARAADNLGPSSSNQLQSSGRLENAAGGSDLQPAGSGGIGGSSSAGLTAPTGQDLQGQAPSQDALKVLAGEADGEPQNPNSTPELPPWLFLVGAAGALGAALFAGVWWRRRLKRTSQELEDSIAPVSDQADAEDLVPPQTEPAAPDSESSTPPEDHEPADAEASAESSAEAQNNLAGSSERPATVPEAVDPVADGPETHNQAGNKKHKRRHKHRR